MRMPTAICDVPSEWNEAPERRPDDSPWSLLRALWRQWRLERTFSSRSPRTVVASDARSAYDAMTPAQFDAFNGPQRWSHRRVIPRFVRSLLPPRPSTIVDLGCGSGDSTVWLTHTAEPGSHIVGYDFSAERLASACRRRYRHADGSVASTAFVCQPITEPLRRADGSRLPANSIDLAFSSGVLGHHLTSVDVARLARELQRVLAERGIAVLDTGPALGRRRLDALMRAAGFATCAVRRLSPFNCRLQVAYRRAW
jgi:SAM-dependent methyltransferase